MLVAQKVLPMIIPKVRIEIRSVNCPPKKLEILRKFLVMKKVPAKNIELILAKPWVFEWIKWKTIVASTNDDGSYTWKIPYKYKKGCYQIKVTKIPSVQYMIETRSFKSAISKTFHIYPKVFFQLQPIFKKKLVEKQ